MQADWRQLHALLSAKTLSIALSTRFPRGRRCAVAVSARDPLGLRIHRKISHARTADTDEPDGKKPESHASGNRDRETDWLNIPDVQMRLNGAVLKSGSLFTDKDLAPIWAAKSCTRNNESEPWAFCRHALDHGALTCRVSRKTSGTLPAPALQSWKTRLLQPTDPPPLRPWAEPDRRV